MNSCVKRMDSAGVMQTVLGNAVPDEAKKHSIGYDVEVVCQLANGARLTIFEGILDG